MTAKQAKIFARIHSGTSIGYIDGFAFMDNHGNQDGIPEADQQKMLDACYELSTKILKGLPEIPNSFDIYKYVMANY